jgi:hypothetical protein
MSAGLPAMTARRVNLPSAGVFRMTPIATRATERGAVCGWNATGIARSSKVDYTH